MKETFRLSHPARTPVPPAHSALTLIELLVVIAIIGILAALIFPAVSRMERAGQSAQCVSNLRQLYGLLQQDIQTYNGVIPPAQNQTGSTEYGVPPNGF